MLAIKRIWVRLVSAIFWWFGRALGIDRVLGNIEYYFRQTEGKLVEIEARLSAMQVDKTRAKPQEKHKAPTIHDYEASQRAVLDEFKEQ